MALSLVILMALRAIGQAFFCADFRLAQVSETTGPLSFSAILLSFWAQSLSFFGQKYQVFHKIFEF